MNRRFVVRTSVTIFELPAIGRESARKKGAWADQAPFFQRVLSRESGLVRIVRAVAVGVRTVASRVGRVFTFGTNLVCTILRVGFDVLGGVRSVSLDHVRGILGVGLDIVRGIFLRAVVARGERGESGGRGERGDNLHRLSPDF